MEILNVSTTPLTAETKESIHISFTIKGAKALSFMFPFSNESLTEKKLEFIKEEAYAE